MEKKLRKKELSKIRGGIVSGNTKVRLAGDDTNTVWNCSCTGTGNNNNQATSCTCADSGCKPQQLERR